jgi:hypothetical protein
MPSTPHDPPRKHYVRPAKGQKPDDQEALSMGYALFDHIASEQAKAARQGEGDGDQPGR